MTFTDTHGKTLVEGRDFPKIEGKVKFVLHNCKTHVDETVFEGKNSATNALAHIFAGNFGGLLNYENFKDLYKTWLGGVLLFGNALDPTAVNDYGIPDAGTNPIIAHAGQTPLTSQADDLTRGNPDDSETVLSSGSTKLVWTWATSAGNGGYISALGLCHTDVGSFGAGVNSEAQKSLSPFASVACLSSKSYAFGDDPNAVLGVYNNVAYSFYLANSTTVKIYKTPINVSRFKLQGGALDPLGAYTANVVTATIQDYRINLNNADNHAGCYYYFDFANNKLILFGVATQGGDTLLKDEINLDTGAVTSSTITVTGAKLWKFTGQNNPTGFHNVNLSVPTRALILNNRVYVYGITGTGEYDKHPTKMYSINLANTADIVELDVTPFDGRFNSNGYTRTAMRTSILGGLIVNDAFIVNNNKVYRTIDNTALDYSKNLNFAEIGGVSSPVFGINVATNSIAINKLFLATKFLLPTPVQKNASMSMRVEYQLTET